MRQGHTLVELLVAFGIFMVLFSMFALIMRNADRGWEIASDKMIEAQEARRASDKIVGLIKDSNPDWIINGVHYPVTVSNGNTRLVFYRPASFNATGAITSLNRVTFSLDAADPTHLLMKDGNFTPEIVATSIQNFFVNCTGGAVNCSQVQVNITTRREAGFNWQSRVALRNSNTSLGAGTIVVEPAAGDDI